MAAPSLLVDIDFTGNPASGYYDQLRYADGLVSYWRLNSGTTLVDDLGANSGTMTGSPSTVTGALPYDTDLAVSFNGSSQDGLVSDSASLRPSVFTLEGWVKVSSLPGATKDLVAKRGSYLLQMNSSGKLLFSLKNDTTLTTVSSYVGVTTGAWNHVACVYDGANTMIYINGVLDTSAAHTAGIEAINQPLRFAASPTSTSPTYQSTQTGNVIGGTLLTANKPVSTASGDLLIGHLCVSEGGGITITPPTGWVLLANVQAASATNTRVRTYYKIAGGSEPASYTWTYSGNVTGNLAISRFTGTDATAPFANLAYGVANGAAGSVSTGTHLPNVDNNLVLAFFGSDASTTWTESSGTERYDFDGTGFRAMTMCSQSQVTATSLSVTGTPAAGNTGTAAVMLILAGSALDRAAVQLDEFTFWSIARTANQIAKDYEARNGGVGAWVNIPDVKNLEAKRGRNYELNEIEAGTGSATINDLSRVYDPGNTLSIRYPNVVPLRKLRAQASLAGTTYPIARLYPESWPPEWAAPTHAQVVPKMRDGFKPLALASVSGTLVSALSGTQIQKLLDQAGWPRADRAIDAGQFTMAQTVLAADAKALTEIQAIADSELGLFFIDAAGIATFHDYAHRWTTTRSITSQATFADDGRFIPYQGLTPSLDETNVTNEWTVSTASGTTKTAIDAVSQARFFRRSNTRSTQLFDPADAQTVATALLQQTARPALRFDTLTVQPAYSTTIWQTVLGLAISDRVTVIRTPVPAAGGSTIQRDCFIEGIAWSFPSAAQSTWTVTFQLSPCSPSSYYDTLMRYGPVSYWRMNTTN